MKRVSITVVSLLLCLAATAGEVYVGYGEYLEAHRLATREAGQVRFDLSGLLDHRSPELYRFEGAIRNDLSSGRAARRWEELQRDLAAGREPLQWDTPDWDNVADYHRFAMIGRPRLLYGVARADEWVDPTILDSPRPRVSILMYHDIRPVANYSTIVTPHQFEEQVRYLARNGYTFITIGELLDAIYAGGRGLPERCVALTFDDGWSGVYNYAYPILKRYGGTATLYVYTNYVDVGGRSMTWEQYREMLAAGFEIGSHTVSHPDLTNRGDGEGQGSRPPTGYGSYTDRLMHELVDSKLILEERLNIRVRSLALPYGAFDSYVLKSALLAGYEGVLTVIPGNTYVDADTNELVLRRWNVTPTLPLGVFADRLER